MTTNAKVLHLLFEKGQFCGAFDDHDAAERLRSVREEAGHGPHETVSYWRYDIVDEIKQWMLEQLKPLQDQIDLLAAQVNNNIRLTHRVGFQPAIGGLDDVKESLEKLGVKDPMRYVANPPSEVARIRRFEMRTLEEDVLVGVGCTLPNGMVVLQVGGGVRMYSSSDDLVNGQRTPVGLRFFDPKLPEA